MNYISLDLEWNQAYAQKAEAVARRIGCRLRGEVIQIGAVKLDEDCRIVGSFSAIVKPIYYDKIQKHVSELTGITQSMMDHGTPLSDAAKSFREFCGEDFAFLTWGPDDVPMLKSNMKVENLDTSWLDRTYDLQPIFNRQTDGVSKQRSLEYAMEYYRLEQNLPAHDALNDAYFTALVAQKMNLKEGIRTYDAPRGNLLSEITVGNDEEGQEGFESLSALLATPEIAAPACPICGGKLDVEEPSVHTKGQRYLTLFRCAKDGVLLHVARVHRNYSGSFRAKISLQIATKEDIEGFAAKQAAAQEWQKRSRKSRRRRAPRAASNEAGEN